MSDQMQGVLDDLVNCASAWSPVPMSVVVTMAMAVENPADFVADPNSKLTVEQGIAAAAGGIAVHKVSATLTVGSSRRLQGSDRRLQAGTVDVSADIQADTAADVDDLATSVGLITADAMTTSINSALTDAGLPTVTVSSLIAEAAPAPERYVAPTVAPTSPNEESTAHQMTFCGGMAVLALAIQV